MKTLNGKVKAIESIDDGAGQKLTIATEDGDFEAKVIGSTPVRILQKMEIEVEESFVKVVRLQ